MQWMNSTQRDDVEHLVTENAGDQRPSDEQSARVLRNNLVCAGRAELIRDFVCEA